MCGGLYGWTTNRRDLSHIEEDCWDAGMPDVLLHSRASGGAWCSTSAQRDCLKGRFSGPDSWTMWAFWTASWSVDASLMSEIAVVDDVSVKNFGRFSWMCWDRFGRVS